jgi:hypothetical protein
MIWGFGGNEFDSLTDSAGFFRGMRGAEETPHPADSFTVSRLVFEGLGFFFGIVHVDEPSLDFPLPFQASATPGELSSVMGTGVSLEAALVSISSVSSESSRKTLPFNSLELSKSFGMVLRGKVGFFFVMGIASSTSESESCVKMSAIDESSVLAK